MQATKFQRVGTETVQECFKWNGTQLGKIALMWPDDAKMFSYAEENERGEKYIAPEVDPETKQQLYPSKPWPGKLTDGNRQVLIPIGFWVVKNGPGDYIVYEPEFFEHGYRQVR